MKSVQVIYGEVEGQRRLKLIFFYDRELINMVRALPGATWSKALKCWHVADTQGNMNRISDLFIDRSRFDLIVKGGDTKKVEGITGNGTFFLAPLDRQDFIWLEALEDWMRHRRYSKSTIRGYSEVVSTYLRFIKPSSPESKPEGELVRFTKDYILPRGLSISFQNQAISGLKIFYREILHLELKLEQVSRPRLEHRLPNVLSKDEVRRLLGVLRNPKHRIMLSIIYGCGLRCGEVLNLRPGDIDSGRRLLVVRQGKGSKDRVVPISVKLIEMLRQYYKDYRPKVYLFEGIRPGRPYSTRSFQNVLKKAIYLAGIKKSVTLHWLRHSYATHLHESGVDIRYIQEILGHKSSRTTEIYTHVSSRSLERIRSPFDDL